MNDLYNVCISWDIQDSVKKLYFEPEILATGQDIYFSFKDNDNLFYEINATADSNIYLKDVTGCAALHLEDFKKPFIFIKNNGVCNLYINATQCTGNYWCYKDYQQIGLTHFNRVNLKLEPKEAVTWSMFMSYNGGHYESHFCYPFAFFHDFCNIKEINPSGKYPACSQIKSGSKIFKITGSCTCTISYGNFLNNSKEEFYSFSTGNNFSNIIFLNKNINQICDFLIDYYQKNYCYDYEYHNFYVLKNYPELTGIVSNSGENFYLNSKYCSNHTNQILETGFKCIQLNNNYIDFLSGFNCTGGLEFYLCSGSEIRYDQLNCGIFHVQFDTQCINYYLNISGIFTDPTQNYFCLRSGYYFNPYCFYLYCGNCNAIDLSGILATGDNKNFYLESGYYYDTTSCLIYCKDVQLELDQEILNSKHYYYNINGTILPTGNNSYTGCIFNIVSGYFNNLNYKYNYSGEILFQNTGIQCVSNVCCTGYFEYPNFTYEYINEKQLPLNYSDEYFLDVTKKYYIFNQAFQTEKQCLCLITDTGLNSQVIYVDARIKSLKFESFVDSGVCLNLNFYKKPNSFICFEECVGYADYGQLGCGYYMDVYYKESGCNNFYKNGWICSYLCFNIGPASGECNSGYQNSSVAFLSPFIQECSIKQSQVIYSNKSNFSCLTSGSNYNGLLNINKVTITSEDTCCNIYNFCCDSVNFKITGDTNICLYFDFDFCKFNKKSYLLDNKYSVVGYPNEFCYPRDIWQTGICSCLYMHCGEFVYYNNNNKYTIQSQDTWNQCLFGYSIYIEHTGDLYFRPALDCNWTIRDICTKTINLTNIFTPTSDIFNYDYIFSLNEMGRESYSGTASCISGCYTYTSACLSPSSYMGLKKDCIQILCKNYSGTYQIPPSFDIYYTPSDVFCIYPLNLCTSKCQLNTNSLEYKDSYSCSEEFLLITGSNLEKISLFGFDFYYKSFSGVNFQNKNYKICSGNYNYLVDYSGNYLSIEVPYQALSAKKFKVITDIEISNELLYLNTCVDYLCGFCLCFKNDIINSNFVQLQFPKIRQGEISPNVHIQGETKISVKKDINFYQNIFNDILDEPDYDLSNYAFFVKSYLTSGIAYCCVCAFKDIFGETGYCQAINDIYSYDSQEYNFLMLDLNSEIKNNTGKIINSDWCLVSVYSSVADLDINYPFSYRPNSGQGYNYILPIINHISLCNTVCGNTGYYSGEFSESINFNDIFNYKITGGCLQSSLSFAPLWNETGQYFESGGSIPYNSNINLYGNCFNINLCKNQIYSTDCRNMQLNKNYNFTGIQPLVINSNYVLSSISLPVTCSNLELYQPDQTGIYLSGVFYYVYDILNHVETPLKISSPDFTSIQSVCWQEQNINKVILKGVNGVNGIIRSNAALVNYSIKCFKDSNSFNYSGNPTSIININIAGNL